MRTEKYEIKTESGITFSRKRDVFENEFEKRVFHLIKCMDEIKSLLGDSEQASEIKMLIQELRVFSGFEHKKNIIHPWTHRLDK